MAQDRTYFRQLSNYDLINVTRYGDNELALVLAERLDVLIDVDAQLQAMQLEIKELLCRCDILTNELNELENQP